MHAAIWLEPFPFLEAVTLLTAKHRVVEEGSRRVLVAEELRTIQLTCARTDVL